MVIISNAAVKSQNVKDEVSYAISKSKNIIPLLREKCEMPFRLDRFQNIDFQLDYEEAFNRLIKALEIERKIIKSY